VGTVDGENAQAHARQGRISELPAVRRSSGRGRSPSCPPRRAIALRVCSSNFEICSLDAGAKDLLPPMSDHIYKKIELVGSSPNGIEDAVNNAISRAGKTIRNMKWFEVAEVRGNLENNKVAHWQVTLDVGFTLDN
jgi:dodecin